MDQTFEKLLLEQCAPTLAGVKPANLFRIRDLERARRACAEWDRKLTPLGLRVMVLREYPDADACVIYVCRRRWLERILKERENQNFLREMGYRAFRTEDALRHLNRRLGEQGEYPHEIGVFLGYPLADVKGFIAHRGQNYTYCGHWKSYGDPEAARRCSDRYQACIDAYKRMYVQGVPMMKMVVVA